MRRFSAYLLVTLILGIFFLVLGAEILVPAFLDILDDSLVDMPESTVTFANLCHALARLWPLVLALVAGLIAFEFLVKNKVVTVVTYLVLLVGVVILFIYGLFALISPLTSVESWAGGY